MRVPLPLTVVLACVLAACDSESTRSAVDAEPPSTTTVPATAATSALSTPPPAAAPATTAAAPATTAAAPATTAAAPATTVAGVPHLAQVGSAEQAVVVQAAGYGATTAILTAYQRAPGGWKLAFGPWTARVGYNGMAPPGEKREGDGRTPSGVYGFDFMFGVDADPGVRFPYRLVTRTIVWSDDPASPRYNLWVDTAREDAGAEPESMYEPVAYQHGVVIAYNTERTPGLGSAIFLHVSTGSPTAGCVSLPVNQLVQILRWLDPAKNPRIVMGAG